MRRTPALVAGLALLLGAASATAAPLPLHESTVPFSVPSDVHAVVVDVEAGDVTVRAGAPHGAAHKAWDLDEPTFTSTYSNGTLKLTGRCPGHQVAGAVYVDVDTECAVDVSLWVPAGVSLTVTGGAVSVDGVHGELVLTGNAAVTVAGAGPGAVHARSVSSTLDVHASRPSVTDVSANNGLRLRSLVTGGLTVTSESDTVDLTDVTARGALTVRATNGITLEAVRAPQATLTSDADVVTVNHSQLGQLWAVANGVVTLDGLRATGAHLHSTASRVRVLRSRIATLAAQGNDSVAATLLEVPDSVKLTCDASWISLVVPKARYALTTRSSSGHVTVQDVVVDPRSRRRLDLAAEGDVSVT